MKPYIHSSTRRSGFTLIELLVVIAIIAVLMGLISAAVMRVFGQAPNVQTKTELGQMQMALEQFMSTHEVDHIPSRIILREDMSSYQVNHSNPLTARLENSSKKFLYQVFGSNLGKGTGIDWNGDGTYIDPNTGAGQVHELEGDQCLVFFLGGIPIPPNAGGPGLRGFSTNPRDPSNFQVGTKERPFEFTNSRLRLITVQQPNPRSPSFYSYADPYDNGSVYAFFSSYGTSSGYLRYAAIRGSDCQSLTGTNPTPPAPYIQIADQSGGNKHQFFAEKSFQIACAGQDGLFGPGLTAIAGAQPQGQIPPHAQDDQVNFKAGRVGVQE